MYYYYVVNNNNINVDGKRMSKSNLSEKAYREIKKLIVHNILKPGQFITETEMQERLEIGRTPVRDAFRMLENDQLLVIYPRRGVEVANISSKKIRDIFEVRKLLEPEILYNNMDKLDKEWLLEMKSQFSVHVEKNDPQLEKTIIGLSDADNDFHRTIIEACDNSYINKMLNSIFAYLAMICVITSHDVNRFNESNREHVEIIECVLNGKKDKARDKLREHIEMSLDMTLLNLVNSLY